jgi:L-ascorbate metabolism protein UlaG (beta-lactamase superfamily)
MSLELEQGFAQISERYQMARELLAMEGAKRRPELADASDWEFKGGRIHITGSPTNPRTSIYFDDRVNTGKDYWNCALNISSRGTICHAGQPHISQHQAKEGRSKDSYIPWHCYLRREWEAAKFAAAKTHEQIPFSDRTDAQDRWAETFCQPHATP